MNLGNWETMARSIGAVSEDGSESSSSRMALKAIESLLTEGFCRDAVHYYLSNKPGSELLRSVLWQIHPYSAMEECYKVFKDSESEQERIDAIELLRVVADERALQWIPEMLSCEIEGVQNWAIGIVDQLVYSELCFEEDVRALLDGLREHPNSYVREKVEYIESMIKASNERDALLSKHYEKS